MKIELGERVDSDSGEHPMVHIAARALMIAWQETYRDKEEWCDCEYSKGSPHRRPKHEIVERAHTVNQRASFSPYPADDEIVEALDRMATQREAEERLFKIKPSHGCSGGRVTD